MALKVAHPDGWGSDSLTREGQAYLQLQPLWDGVVPRLVAFGLDRKEDSYVLATRLVSNCRHLSPHTDGHLYPRLRLALEAVHGCGVIHGDLREANILVEEPRTDDSGCCAGEQGSKMEADQQAARVWLIDFGQAERGATRQQMDDEMRELAYLMSQR